MTFEGTLESSVLGGAPTLILRTAAGMAYELVKAPGGRPLRFRVG